MTTSTSRLNLHLIVGLARLLGWGSLLAFMLFLLVGSLNLVDFGLGEPAALVLNACLSLAFFVQHTIMVRKSFRQRLAKFVREDYHGAVYTICSGVVLLLLIVFWQQSAHVLAAPQGVLRWLLRAVFVAAIAGFNWGTRSLRRFDPLGISPILRELRGADPPRPMPFTVGGPYRWVRHPLYLFCLLLIWSCPDLTADRLLFNVLWTVWIVVGTVLEERDLVADFGDEYRNYQRSVPVLIPWRIPIPPAE
jgi:protein-S-isoprenylcysteine O-methyltransferase Ste14